MRLSKALISLLSMLIVMTTLSGCMVGPNFHPIPGPQPQSYTFKPLKSKTTASASLGQAGKSQEFVIGENISSQWWLVFHSPQINALVQRGIDNSPNLTAAYAALRQAQEELNVQIGSLLLPAVDLNGNATRQRVLTATRTSFSFPPIYNLFATTVNVSYTLDLWGANRRTIEQYAAQVDYQQFQLMAAYLNLTTNIVTTIIQMASLQEQLISTRQLAASLQKQLGIFRGQFRLGGVSLENVSSQEAVLGQTLSLIPPLENNYSKSHNALAVLVGAMPNENFDIPRLREITLPKDLPVSLPSYIVRQRPDVRAYEALVHAASAQIGVATANLLPTFTLSGSRGWQSLFASTLFRPANIIWSMALQATQPIFHGGALIAQRRAAVAAYDLAMANYQQTVLQAFQNVGDSLRALETDSRTLHETRYTELAAKTFFNLTTEQYRLGGASYLAIIVAEQQYRQATIARIQAEAARFADTAILFQALGGGWWNKGWCVYEPLDIEGPACV